MGAFTQGGRKPTRRTRRSVVHKSFGAVMVRLRLVRLTRTDGEPIP